MRWLRHTLAGNMLLLIGCIAACVVSLVLMVDGELLGAAAWAFVAVVLYEAA
jgi:NADH:ubiquinone oxidoreductase subunit E